MSDPVDRLNAALEGRYRIERELGQGGMATVYLADDLKHDRQVALKVLRPELAAVVGAERFLAEIRTTANLQHPHVLALFDSGEADTFIYYVMPYVAGESLRERLDREKQLPVDESVRLATAIAGALEHAHRKGVIHRDIKPANILLQDGQPVVADFGIALAVGAAGGARLTETGLSVGTPYYMSPEQATGDQHVGPGSDIYALGCVLYEMLVGDPPYTGSTAQAVLGKIISGGPVSARDHRPSVPANVDSAIRCALERLPADRFGSADQFARALGDPGFRHGAEADGGGRSAAGFWKPVALVASAVAVIAMALAGTVSDRSEARVRDVGLRHDAPMEMGFYRTFAVSRDGSFMVYKAETGEETQLWVRSLSDQTSRPLPGTEGAYGTPRISLDGTRVAFASGGDLKVASLDGGPVSTIARAVDPTGGGWTEDGLITFGDQDGRVFRWIDPETGPVREDAVGYCINPNPFGPGELFCGGGGDKNAGMKRLDQPGEIYYWRAVGRGGGAPRAVPGSDFRAVDGEYVVYMSIDGTLMATRIEDRDSLMLGQAVALVPEVRRETYSGAGQYDITDDGTLVYVPGLNAESGRLIRVSQNGQEQELPIEDGAHLRFTASPDGRFLASVVDGLQDQELRLYDLRTGAFQSLDRTSYIGTPAWSPGGEHVVYPRLRDPDSEAIASLEIDSNAGVRDVLTGDPYLHMVPMTYLSRDSLLVGQGSGSGPAEMVDLTASPPTVEPIGVDAFFIEISPDRRWIVYQNQSNPGIQLQPWPGLDRRYLVDPDGQDPQWASSTEFVFWAFLGDSAAVSSGAGLYSVTVDPGQDPPFEDPELIVADAHFADTPGQSFEILQDGDIVYKRSPTENLGYYVRVVPGFVDEMKRRVDEANR